MEFGQSVTRTLMRSIKFGRITDPIKCTVHYQYGMREMFGPFDVSSSGDTAFDDFSETWLRLNFVAEFANQSGLYFIRIYPPLIGLQLGGIMLYFLA